MNKIFMVLMVVCFTTVNAFGLSPAPGVQDAGTKDAVKKKMTEEFEEAHGSSRVDFNAGKTPTKLGKSPKDAFMKVIMKTHLKNTSFDLRAYLNMYENLQKTGNSGLDKLANNPGTTARNDLYGKGLKYMPSLQRLGLLEKEERDAGKWIMLELTEMGKELASSEEDIVESVFISVRVFNFILKSEAKIVNDESDISEISISAMAKLALLYWNTPEQFRSVLLFRFDDEDKSLFVDRLKEMEDPYARLNAMSYQLPEMKNLSTNEETFIALESIMNSIQKIDLHAYGHMIKDIFSSGEFRLKFQEWLRERGEQSWELATDILVFEKRISDPANQFLRGFLNLVPHVEKEGEEQSLLFGLSVKESEGHLKYSWSNKKDLSMLPGTSPSTFGDPAPSMNISFYGNKAIVNMSYIEWSRGVRDTGLVNRGRQEKNLEYKGNVLKKIGLNANGNVILVVDEAFIQFIEAEMSLQMRAHMDIALAYIVGEKNADKMNLVESRPIEAFPVDSYKHEIMPNDTRNLFTKLNESTKESQLTAKEETNILESAKALHDTREDIVILIPQEIRLTKEIEENRERLNKIMEKNGGSKVIYERYSSYPVEAHRNRTDFRNLIDFYKGKGAKIMLLADENARDIISKTINNGHSLELYNEVRTMSTDCPSLNKEDESVCLSELLGIALLGRLVEDGGDLGVRSALKLMLEGIFDENSSNYVDIDMFIDKLASPDKMQYDRESIKERLEYFNNMPPLMKLISELDFKLKVIEKFWTYA
ncbi:MAG: hypothetical protein HQL29_05830 [Candidatus Omnitrophica bacterium]|nr:hypothetical protein [Candidatus Omnitrophota bacterium]